MLNTILSTESWSRATDGVRAALDLLHSWLNRSFPVQRLKVDCTEVSRETTLLRRKLTLLSFSIVQGSFKTFCMCLLSKLFKGLFLDISRYL